MYRSYSPAVSGGKPSSGGAAATAPPPPPPPSWGLVFGLSSAVDGGVVAVAAAAAGASSSPLPPPPSSQLLSPLQLLQGMNRQQLAAMLATRGPVRLSAGPGTGKTRVLVAHIAHLVRAA